MGVDLSQHPQKNPGVSQWDVPGTDPVEVGVVIAVVVIVGSRQPSQPGSWHVEVATGPVAVTVGAGVAPGEVVFGSLQPNQPRVSQVDVDVEVEVAMVVVVVGSLQPNQPGVSHVVVVAVVVEVTVIVVVLSSRQPHHPGVLQVVVLVTVGEVVVVAVVVVVVSEPLLLKNFHRTQSKHSSSGAHGGTSSYTSITSEMTLLIL